MFPPGRAKARHQPRRHWIAGRDEDDRDLRHGLSSQPHESRADHEQYRDTLPDERLDRRSGGCRIPASRAALDDVGRVLLDSPARAVPA